MPFINQINNGKIKSITKRQTHFLSFELLSYSSHEIVNVKNYFFNIKYKYFFIFGMKQSLFRFFIF